MARRGQATNSGSRLPLTTERVLQAAIVLADEGGIGSLSMRRIGQALGVEAMSLYNHVANKDAILKGVVDAVVAEIHLPAAEVSWKSALRQSAVSAHEVLVRHPWAPNLLVTRIDVQGPARWRQMDGMLGCLRRAGFSMQMTHHAFHTLDTYVLGFTVQEVSFPLRGQEQDFGELAAAYLRGLQATEYPHLTEHIRYHIDTEIFDEGDFEFGLDLILDGLEPLLDVADPTR